MINLKKSQFILNAAIKLRHFQNQTAMTILSTILPIFLVILLGWAFHHRGFLPQAFLGPGNRLVFYLANSGHDLPLHRQGQPHHPV